MNVVSLIVKSGYRIAFCRTVLVLCASLLIAGCQPSYTIDQVQKIGRNIGLMSKYNITRQHHRAIARNSRLSIVSTEFKMLEANSMSTAVRNSFQPYFSNIDSGGDMESFQQALDYAKAQKSDFLVFVSLRDPSTATFGGYDSVDLLLAIVDVNNGKSFDKILLKVKAASLNVMGSDIQELLGEGLTRVAKDLSGFGP